MNDTTAIFNVKNEPECLIKISETGTAAKYFSEKETSQHTQTFVVPLKNPFMIQ